MGRSHIRNILLTAVVALVLPGCPIYSMYKAKELDEALVDFHARAAQIKLGDSKEKVLSALQPTQEVFDVSWRKQPESFMVDGSAGQKKVIEIYYFRSARIPDDRVTDDEFTPYVFQDGTLVSIGWTALGGPKTVSKEPAAMPAIAPAPRNNMTCQHIGNTTYCN